MNKLIITIVVCVLFLSISGCNFNSENTIEDTQTPEENTGSKCSRISDYSRKTVCQAMENKDITMCENIKGIFREECVVVLAELVYDKSLINYCNIANANINKILCSALISENIDICFSSFGQGEGLGSSLRVRDCIDLTSRKLRDETLCNNFKSRASEILQICGDSSDCKGQWIDGANDHVLECKETVKEATQ